MKVNEYIFIEGASKLLETKDFCIYVAKNPFWVDCKSSQVMAEIAGKNAIAINMVDADDPKYFDVKMFKYLVRVIDDKVKSKQRVRIICNKGMSRSPSIAMLYFAAKGEISKESFIDAMKDFKKLFYPKYQPSYGIRSFLNSNWNSFFKK